MTLCGHLCSARRKMPTLQIPAHFLPPKLPRYSEGYRAAPPKRSGGDLGDRGGRYFHPKPPQFCPAPPPHLWASEPQASSRPFRRHWPPEAHTGAIEAELNFTRKSMPAASCTFHFPPPSPANLRHASHILSSSLHSSQTPPHGDASSSLP